MNEEFLALAGIRYDKKRLDDWRDTEYQQLPYAQGFEMKALLSRGADINSKDESGRTALHLVVCCGSEMPALYLSGLLCDGGIDRDHVACNLTALMLAATFGYSMVALDLVNKGARVGLSSKGVTALHLAALQGHLGVVKTLLEKGADPQARNDEGLTPAMLALRNGHIEVAKYLSPEEANATHYFESSRPVGDGICSDNECPCGWPGAKLPHGTGYLYISKEVVDFRKDARTEAEAMDKIASIEKKTGVIVANPNALASPLHICHQAALKRGVDLEVASQDAKHWWETGEVPLRPTPIVLPA